MRLDHYGGVDARQERAGGDRFGDMAIGTAWNAFLAMMVHGMAQHGHDRARTLLRFLFSRMSRTADRPSMTTTCTSMRIIFHDPVRQSSSP